MTNKVFYNFMKVKYVNNVQNLQVKMEKSMIHGVEDISKPKLKFNPIQPLDNDPLITFLQTHNDVIHLEDTNSFSICKLETIEDGNIAKEFDIIYNEDMAFKGGCDHLEKNELVKFMFHYEFGNEEWTKIILSSIHDEKIWMGENVVEISANLIHEVTSLSTEGSIPLNEKNVKKVVLENTQSINNGRVIEISSRLRKMM